MFLSASVVLLCMASAIQGLNLEAAMETPCFNISNNPAPLFNMEWAVSLGTVYYPIMNNIDLYRAATDLLQKQPNEIKTGSVYYDSCLTWHMFKDGTLLSKGFNGLTREYKSRPMEGNPDGYVFWPSDGTDVYSGSAYTTMTDNKTFFFSALCLKNGGMAWGVGSATPTLSEETKKKILEHAESLGFKKEHFTELRYDNCKISA
ncbi:hypothetical protein Ocin01_15156 [Orchesella cincta]|uniref:Uncharacterized protein n=1 Tax=Orchesella cincta TaxID=48709 RepID=A0A1D2MEV3_ORCCI|nr:hypothetical protein Ocin01_15156 [Orchesella cincta]